MTDDTIGIDISKGRLDVFRACDGAEAAFGNDARGLDELTSWLAAGERQQGTELVVFEATGRYHRPLEQRLTAAGRPFVKVNPRDARHFVRACGVQAKTDRADARFLARMGAALRLRPKASCHQAFTDLADLVSARSALVKDRVAARNRAHAASLPILKRQYAVRLQRIAAELAALDREIARHLGADPDLAARRDVLRSIPGISDVTAAAILALAPELGGIGSPQAAKLAGLAPITRRSGTWRGKAFVQGGRAGLRRALYMPALVAMRCNPDLERFAGRLRAAGKPGKLIVTAVMRKLVVLANSLLRDRRTWTPVRA